MIFEIFLTVATVMDVWFDKKFGNEYPLQRQAALDEFCNYKVTSSCHSLEFDGAQAKIVHEKAEVSSKAFKEFKKSHRYSFTFFAQNPAGEYFMYVSNPDGKPYFKHVSHTNAKIVLGKKYVEAVEQNMVKS